jgi:hypothetical protein
MELLVFNTEFQNPFIIDMFKSIIWTERYCGYGDFEICFNVSDNILNIMVPDYYVLLKGSDKIMVIEDRQIKYDVESGLQLVVTGRSVESLLDRRIVWSQTVLSGNLQNGIQSLITDNVISPTITDRIIPNFSFELSDDESITSLTVEAQLTRTNLFESIKKLCLVNDIGFKITLSENMGFVFGLYAGTNRSYDQLTNPYVVFSKEFENIINSNYSDSKRKLKTVTVVAGEGEGEDRKTSIVGSGSGINRRELYTDARDLSQTVDGVLMPEADYIAQLTHRGYEDLADKTIESAFDGQVDTTRMFIYGRDFFLGDTVQLVSEYGIKAKAQITEIIRSQSSSGIDIYPTFKIIY